MRKYKVCVLGHFGKGENLLNGQTVKTKIVTEELQKQLGNDQVGVIDTHGGWRTLFKSPFHAIKSLKTSQNVVIFPANNGVRVYAPLLAFFVRFFKHRKLHYAVIGGWLPEFLKNRKALSNCLKKFDCIYVETHTMKTALEQQGFNNIFVMPNCKKLTRLSEKELVFPAGMPYKLCTFSRVMKEKGIEDAIEAVIRVNSTLNTEVFSLDIYGQVDENQFEWFCSLKEKFPSYVRYAGVVPFEKSVEVLKKYFALLFPTYYDGEGFAGTLIDAMAAGIPVIASDWKYNSEIVNDNVGRTYPTRDVEALVDVLKSSIAEVELFCKIKKLCLAETEKYEIGRAVKTLIEQLG